MAVDNSRQVDFGGEDLIVRSIFTNISSPGLGTSTGISTTGQMVDSEQFSILQSDNTFGTGALSAGAGTAVFSSPVGTVTLPASTQYIFEGQYYITDVNSSISHAYQTLFAGTAGLASIAYSANGWLSAAGGSSVAVAGVQSYNNVATKVTVTNTSSSATTNGVITLWGTLTVSAGGGGTFIPQIASSAALSAGSGAPVIKAGSYFRMWSMGTASTATVGAWS